MTADSAARQRLTIRPIEPEDITPLADRFSQRLGAHELFARYAREHRDGTRTSLAAWADDSPVGFSTLLWHSAYPPFAQSDLPNPVIGLAVGLDDQYAAARRLYARLGYRHDGRDPWPTEIGPMHYHTRPLRPPA